MMAKQKKETKKDIVIAKTDDGTIQITFTIDYSEITKERSRVEKELIADVVVPGFRKGKAPLAKALEKVSENTIIEHTLQHILPKKLASAITEHKLKLAMYPKFEILKADVDKDWEIRATTAEFPEFELGNYKEKFKSKTKGKEEKTPEQKQEFVITTLLENVKITIPRVLIDEETNSRLSQLLERIDKLGLQLESYLASIGKTPDSLRKEYEKQATDTLSLELILQKIADTEGIAVSENELNSAIAASGADPELAKRLETPEQKRALEAILRKRKVIEKLTELFF